MKHAGTDKEISCIIGHLFETIEVPCNKCRRDLKGIVISGRTYSGNEATLHLQEGGIYQLEGPEDLERELEEIRCGRCLHEHNRR